MATTARSGSRWIQKSESPFDFWHWVAEPHIFHCLLSSISTKLNQKHCSQDSNWNSDKGWQHCNWRLHLLCHTTPVSLLFYDIIPSWIICSWCKLWLYHKAKGDPLPLGTGSAHQPFAQKFPEVPVQSAELGLQRSLPTLTSGHTVSFNKPPEPSPCLCVV